MNQDKTIRFLSKVKEIFSPPRWNRDFQLSTLILTAAAFALLQIVIAGYSVGVGNQTIQIPFVQRFADNQLYSQDVTLNDTIDQYPSYAYRLLALFCRLVNYKIVYAFLHLLSCFLLALAILQASLVLWRSLGPGLICLTVLLAGHHRALAGAELYVAGFTHTWFSFAIAVWSFVFLWQRRFTWSLITVGLLFNLHALMAAYTAVFLLVMYVSWWQFKEWRRFLLSGLLAVVCALPTLVFMIIHTAEFTPRWLALMFIRSSHHSFPVSLWQDGNTSIPRFAAFIGLSVLCIPLLQERVHRRMIVAVIMTTIATFAVGLATDLSIVVRAQLWRCSAFPLLLAILVIAQGLWRCWQPQPPPTKGEIRSRSRQDFGHPFRLSIQWWFSGFRLYGLVLALTVLVCTFPALINNVYLCFCLLTISACLLAIISWQMALLVSMCHVVCLSAIFFIDFPVLHLPSNLGLANINAWQIVLVILCLGIMVLNYLLYRVRLGLNQAVLLGSNPRRTVFCGVLLVLTCGLILWQMMGTEDNDWVDAQKWARENTPQDAVFLTPVHRSGFRIHSQRAVVTEWRDGTLLYFAPDFTVEWWQRIKAARPGIEIDEERRQLIQPGLDYSVLSDEQLIRLCDRHHVDFLLLPKSYLGNLWIVYSNQTWNIAQPEFPPPKPVPGGVKDEATWHAQETFMRDVIEPNIEKHRKGDLTIEIRDADGKAVYDLKYQLELTKHAFHFGSGLGFFVEPPKNPDYDFIPSVVKEVDKKHFLEVFNFSIIPYTGKWFYTEAEEGKPFYDDLDAYVNWCFENQIEIEYHFVTGYPPKWLESRPQEEKQQQLLRRSNELIDRYGGKIHYWQVVNEKHLLNESIAAFKLFRQRLPDAKLGISDCARFYSPHQAGSQARFDDLTRGLHEIHWLKEQGVELDFFGFHGHRPFGLWADLRAAYEALDVFEKERIRIHISEFGIHEVHNIEGDVREGQWNADLQGRYYEMIYSTMFSHPVVDAINMWGMSANTWMTGSGLVDNDGHAKPSFYALHNLIHKKWHTSEEGVLPLNGTINYRAFYGDYLLQLELEDGRTIDILFRHQRGETKPLIFSIDNTRLLRVE